MSEPISIEDRVAKLEAEMPEVRHLAVAASSDVAEFKAAQQATIRLINALRETQLEQGAESKAAQQANVRSLNALRETQLEHSKNFRLIEDEFRKIDQGFLEMRARFDQTAAGMEHIARLITAKEGDAEAE